MNDAFLTFNAILCNVFKQRHSTLTMQICKKRAEQPGSGQ